MDRFTSNPRPFQDSLISLNAKSKQSSKAQATVWIVMALILLLSFVLVFYQSSADKKRLTEFVQVGQQWDVSSINGLVQTCFEKLSTDSVFYFGMVGDSRSASRDFFAGNYFDYDDRFKIPYYFMNGRPLMPSQAQAAQIIEAYVDENMPACTAGFQAVKGFVVEPGLPKTTVRINEKTVDFSLYYPLKIVRGEQQTVLDEWSFRLESRLYQILNIAKIIVDNEAKDDRFVYWDFMVDVTRLSYNMTAYAERDNTILYRIVDPSSQIYFEPFVLQFANRVKTG